MKWYREYGRTLPWRETTDPYRIFLSEIMLQQTQVSRGLLYYEQFTQKFPNWEALAEAPRADVLKAWSGLGYNRRAIFIHEAAQQVVERGVPQSYEEWLEIKGVGKYTAAALTVFSLRQKAYPVDTNIRRVIGRLFLDTPFAELKDDPEVEEVLRYLIKGRGFYDVPQALFDLSTAHCQPNPICETCPLRKECPFAEDFLAGKVEIETQKKAKEKIRGGKQYPDRIYRGRILKLVHDTEEGQVSLEAIGPAIDSNYTAKDLTWVRKMVERMHKDGLLVWDNDLGLARSL